MGRQPKRKETEIGMIPQDWDVTTLEDISLVITDGSHFSPEEKADGTKIIATVKDMTYNCFDLQSCKRISDTDFENLVKSGCSPNKGDILISKDGANCLDLIFVYNQDKKVVLLSSIAIVQLKPTYNSQFYRYYLLSPNAQRIMRDGYVSGSAIPRVILKDFKRVPVPKPPRDIEDLIANILYSLDSKIEVNRQMNTTLEKIGQALFKHWFIDFEFPNEKGKPYKSSGGEMADSELGEIPKGWQVKKIGEVISIFGGTTPSTKERKYWEGGTIHWATPKDLSELDSPVLIDTERKITPQGLATISSGLLPAGTVLLSSRAPIGYTVISQIPVSINQGFIAMVCNREPTNYYVFSWVQYNLDIIKSVASGTTFEEVNKSNFKRLDILIPPSGPLSKFSTIFGSLYECILNSSFQTRTLASIRDSLLPRLMSGRIRVCKN